MSAHNNPYIPWDETADIFVVLIGSATSLRTPEDLAWGAKDQLSQAEARKQRAAKKKKPGLSSQHAALITSFTSGSLP